MNEAATDQHIRAAYDVVAQRRDFHLEPRDVAILVLMLHELSRRSGQTFSISAESLRALSIKADTFEGLPPPAANGGSPSPCPGCSRRRPWLAQT